VLKKVKLKYPIFLKGKGLPKEGACVLNEGQEVEVRQLGNNLVEMTATYRGKQITWRTLDNVYW
jgi:hypothetical protein